MIDIDNEERIAVSHPSSGILYFVVPALQMSLTKKLFQEKNIYPLVEPGLKSNDETVLFVFSFVEGTDKTTIQGILDSVDGTGIAEEPL
jgi:hypothetical protein